MPTARKRNNSGFQTKAVTTTEQVAEKIEEPVIEPVKEEPQVPVISEVVITPEEKFVEQEIMPVADPGPRFIEKIEEPAKQIVLQSPPQLPKQPVAEVTKRHPRNIPKFSAHK